MSVPGWWDAVLLGLAAWRVFHLVAFDDILDRPRRYVTRLAPGWRQDGDATGDDYRDKLAGFIVCPFCLGFWTAVVWWAAWQLWPHATLVAATPFALSAVVVGAQRLLSSE